MVQNKYLHHYTTLNTLALILKSRKIRFNRLDRVDDIREASKYGDYHLSRLLFVSCWTDVDEERIPLWDRYSKGMTGVKISLPVDPFEYRPLAPHPIWGGKITGQILSFLPIEEIITNEYMVNVACLFVKSSFIKKVIYIDEGELTKIREQAVRFVQANGRPMFQIDGPQNLAGYKSKEWDNQQEVRYILMVFPTPPIPPSGMSDPKWIQDGPKYLLKSISEGVRLEKEHFDIPIDQNHLDNIGITLGPSATEGDRVIAETLLEKYTKNGSLSVSKFTGKIRRSTE